MSRRIKLIAIILLIGISMGFSQSETKLGIKFQNDLLVPNKVYYLTYMSGIQLSIQKNKNEFGGGIYVFNVPLDFGYNNKKYWQIKSVNLSYTRYLKNNEKINSYIELKSGALFWHNTQIVSYNSDYEIGGKYRIFYTTLSYGLQFPIGKSFSISGSSGLGFCFYSETDLRIIGSYYDLSYRKYTEDNYLAALTASLSFSYHIPLSTKRP